MFVFRQAKTSDVAELKGLARNLGFAGSLPMKRDELEKFISVSEKSFKDSSTEKKDAKYLFVLENLETASVVGSSLLYGKLGSPGKPHISLRILYETFQDPTTMTNFKHQKLRVQYDEDGPSGIGGLILHPKFRKTTKGLGSFLSFARFLYAAFRPDRFEKNVLAELLPPFRDDGSSELWEAFGKRFTGMSYDEADRLSRTNKDFIANLFPKEDIYTCLFTEAAREVIGKTGASTRAAEKLLESIGFRFLETVDPFDGGPYFGAAFSEISLIEKLKHLKLDQKKKPSSPVSSFLGYEGSEGFECVKLELEVDEDSSSFSIQPADYEVLKPRFDSIDQVFLVTAP